MKTSDFLKMFLGGSNPPVTMNAAETIKIESIGNLVWATARAASTGNIGANPSLGINCVKDSDNFFFITRTFCKFDFSAIVGTVTEATLSFLGTYEITGVYVQACSNNSGTLVADDFDDINGTVYGNGITFAYDDFARKIFSVTLNAAALAAINAKGVLRFVLRDYRDYNDTAPTTTESRASQSAQAKITYKTV